MTGHLGSFHSGSARSQLMGYFEANPDEELTVDQAMTKFGISRTALLMAAQRLVNENRLEHVRVIRRVGKAT